MTRAADTLRSLRSDFGRTAAPLAGLDFWQGDDSWAMLTGVALAEYNLLMVGGEDAPVQVGRFLEALHEHGLPGMVMVAPGGESAHDPLTAAGWRHLRDVPFMRQDSRRREADPGVRALERSEMCEARVAAAESFGGSMLVGEALFNEHTFSSPDAHPFGAFTPDGRLAGCGVLTVADEAICGWGMGVRPAARRSSIALRLVASGIDYAARLDPPRPLLFTATEMGARLQAAMGGTVLEPWQVWSRRRWLIGD